ncbi:beta-glucosidase [Pseudidiomarina sp. 1APP75-32.1]|uniref:Beta-glucosidase n=1 Tax=Pseudidiomarina terrestris TaxID=2820060 RepID=A0AAW7QZK0_9GAMM|nr:MULTISPECIES: GH1 family beta-glucosidase [unclassified Pseudidiomarina]MDN7124157.1 beta-glucosidase [Pseudidiomarina sp. 1APP75-32.1]MDN7128414.1 beta-glucosidase [Pseudidiomarina sp. 1APR75-15]
MTKISLPKHSKLLSSDFLFGVATSSFQIEGAADQRAPSIWDTFCAEPGRIKDGSDGLHACQHVKYWRQDLDIITELGVDAYRFSIAWGRVINADGSVNRQGLQFYIDLVDALLANGIQAHVTLYHWDLPQYLEDQGGWLNRDTAYRFAEYADIVGRALGNKVASYATINEPFCSAYLSYEAGIHAPGHKNRQEGRQAAHHLLLAHGLAMPVLRRHAPQALHGIVLNFSPCHPASDSEADRQAALQAHQYHNLWYLQPLLEASYPDLLNQLPEADRPDIAADDMATIGQSLDFLGVNYYTRTVFREKNDWFSDVPPQAPPLTSMGWEIYPQGLTEILTDLNQRFANLPPIYITENGAAFPDEVRDNQVDDAARIDYYQQHLLAVHDCIEAGVTINGYFAWSLLDNFEWAEGYSKRFGIVYVDFDTQQRILKSSALALQTFWLQRKTQLPAVEAL